MNGIPLLEDLFPNKILENYEDSDDSGKWNVTKLAVMLLGHEQSYSDPWRM